MERPTCPINKILCQKSECLIGICEVTGNVNSFELLSESKSEILTAKQLQHQNENHFEIRQFELIAPVAKMLHEIYKKEPEALIVLIDIIKHIHGTYSDKYQSDASKVVDTKYILTKMEGGKWANSHSALKYIQRYISIGFPKSNNPLDLRKAIHYLVFELTRCLHSDKQNIEKDIIEK